MRHSERYCFIGAGSMAEAIISGMIASCRTEPAMIHVINRQDRERLIYLHNRYGIQYRESQQKALSMAEVIILAVKPKDLTEALKQWGEFLRPHQRVVSVIAGIATPYIEEQIPQGVSVIRTMPNTSSVIGRSATAICGGRFTKESDLKATQEDFNAIGTTVLVDEKDMDAVTALSGSGPAYIYYLVEALVQAGVNEGLSPSVSRQLTTQTLLGASHMLQETGEDPAVLRQKVTSPGGTTMAGIETLKEHQFHMAITNAIHHARKRSEELGATFSPSITK
ncbi:pyrroline-5-carboxylate reductase [Marininema halotolerans]|uniref:Pyrroline-5-carboxylate reductase n=1 Tax=Marininema halotolerans TaxID=1155944 RepID=A0A1I6NQK4_9BACL|nr:pyrroline-5-carboxylate reductase [Marininema halotolerans]SFS30174.1 pyrroline-5-carboxylate reductase [Marininema halotolerans]